MKLSKRIKSLLFEAFRRNDIADARERSKPLGLRWLGLGTASAYKTISDAGLMVFHDGRTPPAGCMGWLVLTPAGERAFNEYAGEFSVVLTRLKKETRYNESYASQFQLIGGITR